MSSEALSFSQQSSKISSDAYKATLEAKKDAEDSKAFGMMMATRIAEIKDRASILKTANDMAGQ